MPGEMRQNTTVAGGAIPSTQSGALPHWAIPEMDEERDHGGMWAVSVQDTDTEPPIQRLQAMEIGAEKNSVGRGSKSYRKREESLQDPRPPRGRAVHPVKPRLPAHHQGGE